MWHRLFQGIQFNKKQVPFMKRTFEFSELTIEIALLKCLHLKHSTFFPAAGWMESVYAERPFKMPSLETGTVAEAWLLLTPLSQIHVPPGCALWD